MKKLSSDPCFKCENVAVILDWVEPGAGFWSGGESANVLKGGGEKKVDCLFSFLLDGFANTAYLCFRMLTGPWWASEHSVMLGS